MTCAYTVVWPDGQDICPDELYDLGNLTERKRRMQSEKGGKHSKPHIHALYGDNEIVMGIDGDVLEGNFPNKQMKLLLAWVAIHEDELRANWELLSNGDGYFKIEPLR